MSDLTTRIISLLLAYTLCCAGCAIPMSARKSAPESGNPNSLTATPQRSAEAPRSVPMPQAPPANMQYAPPQTAMSVPNQGVAQVGFSSAACQSGSCGGCNQCSPSSCGSASCTGGCGQCAPQAPHGYITESPFGWNAHGIDPQEFLCDGGDRQQNARVLRDDSVAGLEPEDTVVHYTTEAGDSEVLASNRVCIYAPRFASVRKISGALAGGRAVGPAQFDRPQGTNEFELEQPGIVVTDSLELAHAEVTRRVDAMRDRNRGVPVEGILQPEMSDEVLAALASLSAIELNTMSNEQKALIEELSLAAVTWTLDEALEVAIEDMKPPVLTRDEHLRGLTIYEFPDAGRLRICKLADRGDALPGEVVNFTIRVENVGDSSVNQVVLADNLTTRLEYVVESQECTVEADFEPIANEGQSLRLQWTLTEPLEVGDSATIRFQCKVR